MKTMQKRVPSFLLPKNDFLKYTTNLIKTKIKSLKNLQKTTKKCGKHDCIIKVPILQIRFIIHFCRCKSFLQTANLICNPKYELQICYAMKNCESLQT